MELLIEMYQQHPRLWQASHSEHNDAEKCRQSWQEIKQKWNRICKTNLREIDIRIRLSTLKQRYLKERDRQRLFGNDNNFDSTKHKIQKRFCYFEKLKFLDEQEVEPYNLQNAQINREYSKLIEIYAHFPMLWNKNDAEHKHTALRQQAYEAICTALQLIGIHLSIEIVRLRISTLKHRYRISKIQHLKCRLKSRTFVPSFKQYNEMRFLDKHVAPYVCDVCSRIFRLFNEYQRHLEKEAHNINQRTTCAGSENDTAEEHSKMESIKVDGECKEMDATPKLVSEYANQHNEAVEMHLEAVNKESKETVDDCLTQTHNVAENIIAVDNVVKESQNKALPTAEASNNVDEQNVLTTLEQPIESLNDMPIIIMETTLEEHFQNQLSSLAESNLMEATELQHLILLDGDNALLNSAQIVFIEEQGFAIQPMLKSTQCDESKTQSKFIVKSDDYERNVCNTNEDNDQKVYTNLVNFFHEYTVSANNCLPQATDSCTTDMNSYEVAFHKLQPTVKQPLMSKDSQNDFMQKEVLVTEIATQMSSGNKMEMQDNANNQTKAANESLEDIESNETTEAVLQTMEYESNNEAISTPMEQTNSLSNQILTPALSPIPEVGSTTATALDSIHSSDAMDFNTNETQDSTTHKKQRTPIEITDVQILQPIEPLKNVRKVVKKLPNENARMKTRSSKALIANITSENFKLDVPLSPNTTTDAIRKRMPYTLTRLTEPQGHKLIELYRLNPQLWNPEHPNFASRRHNRLSWRLLATQFNDSFYLNYNWFQVHRKMMDYIKYYRREQKRLKTKPNVPKWTFFEELKFLDEVSINTTGLEKRMQQRQETLKIIEIYKAHPQLWDTAHVQYRKRNQRQCTIAQMCSRLQELHNITIEPTKLKQCLLELRYNYRATKLARIEAEKRNETFEPILRFEFYDALQFLDTHVPPFNCEKCKIEFKCFSEFSAHCKKEHKQQQQQQSPLLANDIDDGGNMLDNVCHICGIKFTLRQNLVQHLNRHYCERSLSCSVCDKKFFTKAALDEHERTHSRVPAVICPECGRTFFNNSKLNQHLKRHRNQRDYPCEQCGKAFYSAFDRERHMQRHLNIRDKICPVCGKSFVAGSSYYTHIKLHNKTKQYSCTSCKLEFSQYAGLYKHRKKYHP